MLSPRLHVYQTSFHLERCGHDSADVQKVVWMTNHIKFPLIENNIFKIIVLTFIFIDLFIIIFL